MDVRRSVRRARHRRVLRRLAGPRLLRRFAQECPDAFFVEIGSNDGEQHDHLRPIVLESRWRGIMVEPVPYVFERLRANYGAEPRIALENVAISDRDGSMPFHHLAEAPAQDAGALPQWYDGIGSFSREAVLRHAEHIPDIAQRIVTTEVPCLTFASLCALHRVEHVDLLLVDTEGHDFEILRAADLGSRQPRLVVYEHFHLSPEDRASCRALLEDLGYATFEEGFDTWCLRPRGADDLTRYFDRLRPAVPGVSVHDA